MQEAALAVFDTEFLHQCGGVAALGGAQRVDVPFGCVAVGGGDERWLAAHGQAHIALDQITVHHIAQRQHFGPLVFGIRLGDTRRFINALHAHMVCKPDFGFIDATLDGRGAGGLRRAGQRDVAFACHQAGGRVQADPACAR